MKCCLPQVNRHLLVRGIEGQNALMEVFWLRVSTQAAKKNMVVDMKNKKNSA